MQAGARLAIVNRGPTPYDRRADLKIDASAAETLAAVIAALDLRPRPSYETMETMRLATIVVISGRPSRRRHDCAPAARAAGQCRAGSSGRSERRPPRSPQSSDGTTGLPAPGGGLLTTFPKLNGLGYPTTFSIVGAIVDERCEAAWYRVKLPIRPNGVVGYVRPRTSPSRR